MSKQQSYNSTKSKSKDCLMLMLICFCIQIIIFISAGASAYIIGIKSNSYYIFTLAVLCIACFASGFFSVRKTKKNGLFNGIFYSFPSVALLIIISAFMNLFKIDYNTIISILLLLASSAIGGVLSVNIKPKAKIRTKGNKR